MTKTHKSKGKKSLILIVIVLGVILVVVGGFVFAKSVTAPTKVATTTNADTTTKDSSSANDTADAKSPTTTKTATVDPSTLDSIDIQPFGITVSYTKGTPGFSYDIQKAEDKTQYVEFTSTDLVGTKCTNDQGIFATILKNPTSAEDPATVTATAKVGNDTYDLLLSSDSCTSNADLLTTYQTGFKAGFSSLKAIAQ